MNIFILLAAALLLILYLLRRHIPIGPCMLAGGLLIWGVRSTQPGDLVQSLIETLSLSRTYDIILALYFVMGLEIELRKSGALSGMVHALQRLFSGTKLLLAVMPAFLGLLPSLGGARFSAPIVEELSKDINLTPEKKSAINFWFRHIFEFSSPIIPGMIMACSIAGVPFSAFLKHLSWLTVLAFITGWFVLVHFIHTESESPVIETEQEKKQEKTDLILSLAPVITTFLLVVMLDFNASWGLGLVTLVMYFILQAMNRGVTWKDILLGAFDRKMLINVICILYFIQLLTVTNVLTEIVYAFQNSTLPVPVIIACVSLLIGILTGLSQGHVAIVMPIVAAMGTGNLDLAGIAMAFGVAGQMLTPTHMCLIVTIDYFKSGLFGTLKPILICEIIILAIFSIYTYFTWGESI